MLKHHSRQICVYIEKDTLSFLKRLHPDEVGGNKFSKFHFILEPSIMNFSFYYFHPILNSRSWIIGWNLISLSVPTERNKSTFWLRPSFCEPTIATLWMTGSRGWLTVIIWTIILRLSILSIFKDAGSTLLKYTNHNIIV